MPRILNIIHDDEYRDFVFRLLMMLEPRLVSRGTVLFDEMEGVQEFIFIMSGNIDIGFKVNNKPQFVVRRSTGNLVGGYECCYDVNSHYLYKCRETKAEGFMLRKTSIFDLKEDFEDLMRDFSENIKRKFFTQVKFVIERERRAYLERYKKTTQDNIVTLLPKDTIVEESPAKGNNPFRHAVFEFI